MPEIIGEARTTLKETFEEVADRANRLREWIVYQEKLHPLKNSFGIVLKEVEDGVDANTGFKDGSFSRIKDRWIRCREQDLLGLQIFHEDVQYINKPLGAAVKVKYDASKFLDLRDLIEQDVVKARAGDLKDHCAEFDNALTIQLVVLRTTVQDEMVQLCDLTKQLHKDFARE